MLSITFTRTAQLWLIILSLKEYTTAQEISGFNAALHKPISANVTCGSPPEQFYNTRQGEVPPRLRVLSLCDANNASLAHPPALMVDGDLSTSWQSRNSEEQAFIRIDLQQELLAKAIVFRFGDYRRPGQMVVAKSTDFGHHFLPWHYVVTTRTECTTVFKIQPADIHSIPDQVDRVLCTEYGQVDLEYGESYSIDLNGNQRGDGSDQYDSDKLRAFMSVTNVFITFSGLYKKFDLLAPLWHHYVVSELSVLAVCDCSGHGDGVACPMDTSTQTRRCQCQDNTCGEKCDTCCPGFNQYPWKRGSQSSWKVDPSTACQGCNCFGHSSICIYNETVAALKLSLDLAGNYSGGGVCQDCQHNTEGINCQRCLPFFYRPEGRSAGRVDACIQCNCFGNGSTPAPGFAFLECIRDEVMAQRFSGMKSGDCFCKGNVAGRRCDECKDGYYDLQGSNALGCTPCACVLAGTVNGSNICIKDRTGQCPCKTHARQRDCRECADGYYNLQETNSEGCTWCDCDIGASRSLFTCHKVTGQCDCRSNTTGRQCTGVAFGFYFPSLHFIHVSRMTIASSTFLLTGSIFVPREAMYAIKVSFRQSGGQSFRLQLNLRSYPGGEILEPGNQILTDTFACTSLCVASVSAGVRAEFRLRSGFWNVTVTNISLASGLIVERVTAVPLDFVEAFILPNATRNTFLQTCNVDSNDMRIGSPFEAFCLRSVFSLTIAFNDGALPCACDPIGAINATCQEYGGQCFCKPGVGDRSCSQCLPGFFNFSLTGCTPCRCNGPDNVCHPQTGVCNCPPNTVGDTCTPCQCNNNSNQCLRNGDCINCQFRTAGNRCQFCLADHYGNPLTAEKCLACDCHPIGAVGSSCSNLTGQCQCRPGVVGRRCDTCAPFYYSLTSTGCTSCRCNPYGSTSLQCSSSGVCTCQPQATGRTCDRCIPGFFGLPAATCNACGCHPQGSFSGTDCDPVTGQCQCKIGVGGRTCNQCARQYVNFTVNGCELCPLCTRQMQSHVDEMNTQRRLLEGSINQTQMLPFLHQQIGQIEDSVARLQVAGTLYEQRLTQGQRDYILLNGVSLPMVTSRHSRLVNQISVVATQASVLAPISRQRMTSATLLLSRAENSFGRCSEANDFAAVAFSSLVALTTTSTTLLTQGFGFSQGILALNVDSQDAVVRADLTLSNTLQATVVAAGETITAHQRTASSLTNRGQRAGEMISSLDATWRQQGPQFSTDVQTVYSRGEATRQLLNENKLLLNQQGQYINDVRALHRSTETVLNSAMLTFLQAHSIYESNQIQTLPITGEVQVTFFALNLTAVRVQVLAARNLATRDHLSGLADPYFLLSIRPDTQGNGILTSQVAPGTLNPIWTNGNSKIFFLQQAGIAASQIVIQILDRDIGDSDDFMGEAVISLGSVLPTGQGSETRLLALQQEDLSSAWSGKFSAAHNGLADLQVVLSSQLSSLNSLLGQANEAVGRAETQASQLQAQTSLLSNAFAEAQRHAARAIAAVTSYRSIGQLVAQALEKASEANRTVQSIAHLMLTQTSITKLSEQAGIQSSDIQSLLSAIRGRNVSIQTRSVYVRSETLGSTGIGNPPRAYIQVDGVDYSKGLDGHNVVVLSSVNGKVEESVNFRTDLPGSAAAQMTAFLQGLQSQRYVIIAKQGEGEIPSNAQLALITELLVLGARAPFFSGRRGSYAFIGYRRSPGQALPTAVRQVNLFEGQGVSEIRATIQLSRSAEESLVLANQSFQSNLGFLQGILQLYPQLVLKTEQLRTSAQISSVIDASLQAATIILEQAVTSAQRILREAQSLATRTAALMARAEEIQSNFNNGSDVLQVVQMRLVSIGSKMTAQQSMVSNASAEAIFVQQASIEVSGRLVRIEERMTRLSSAVAGLPFAIRFQNGGGAGFSMMGQSTQQSAFDLVTLDFRTNSTNGLLFYAFSSPGELSSSFGIYLDNGYVKGLLFLGSQELTVQNPMPIQQNTWYTISISRIQRYLMLTIVDAIGLGRTAVSLQASADISPLITLSSSSVFYLANLQENAPATLSSRFGAYSGDMDNLHFHDVNYNLWNATRYRGQRLFVTPRYGYRVPVSYLWISFYGSGFLSLAMGTFRVREASSFSLEFRTVRDNSIILGVASGTGSLVYTLYLREGKVTFQFATQVGNNVALMTSSNTYINGDWYRVHVVRHLVNASMAVRRLTSQGDELLEERSIFTGSTLIEEGAVLFLGSHDNSSSVAPPVSNRFAGDIRNLLLSSTTSSRLTEIRFNSSQVTYSSGVTSYDLVTGQIVAGARFFGFTQWSPIGSFSGLPITSNALLQSLSIVIKTRMLNGLLMYSSDQNQYLTSEGIRSYLYLALVGGNLFALHHTGDATSLAPFVTRNVTLSDGLWHNITILYYITGYQIMIDNRHMYTGWLGNMQRLAAISNPLYLGGLPPGVSIPFPVPTTYSLAMDVQSFLLNGRLQNFHQGNFHGVSYAGVLTSAFAPPPPPICGLPFQALTSSSNEAEVGFGLSPWGASQSFIGFVLSEAQRNFFSSSFVITLEFRATSEDGAMFFLADSDQHPTQIVSLELVQGHLLYQFSTGTRLATIKTTTLSADNGQWHKLYLLRIFQFGALLLPNSKEYQNTNSNDPPQVVPLGANLYIGGIPPSVNASSFMNSKMGFSGCIRKFEVSSAFSTLTFDLTKPDLGGSSSGTSTCYKDVEPGAYFNGSSWIQFGSNFTLPADFTLEFKFKTWRQHGIFFYLVSRGRTNSATNSTEEAFVLVQLKKGQIETFYKPQYDQPQQIVMWMDSTSNSSFHLCDQQWHHLNISKVGAMLSLAVDGNARRAALNGQGAILKGDALFGGLQADVVTPALSQAVSEPLHGCVKGVTIDNKSLFSLASRSRHTVQGCPREAS